ncbi:hypothetical protein OPV22_022882 [Ensete ventricosum]|uniref:Uncharacterized protein n=1 Tax=Ensete ventricosum TaxID=4639 RepID=A0AAV8QTI1_ENSVE|nr:hypothetical protein OPV22_022882 [Ensete ventricosum]
MSTGSSRQAFTGRWGTSPVKTNRGSSASPKLHGWQTNLPGFSTDVPPNLQTSLTDRSASRVRDLSPASVNGIGFGPKFGRQSISPYSRSVRFSHDSEGDCFSFISKPSAASSFEDDVESHSPVRVSTTAATIKYRDFANARAMQFSKKISRVTSANSAPKRSFDSALRKMDHRKLLRACSGHCYQVFLPLHFINASSVHGASVAPDMEDDDHDQSDLVGEWEKKKSEFQEEVFCFDKLDGICEDTGHDTCSANLLSGGEIFDGSTVNEVDSKSKLECSTVNDGDAVNTAAACRGLLYAAEFAEIGSAEKMNQQIDHAPVQTQDSVEDFQESCLSISHKDVLLSELESKTAEDPSSEVLLVLFLYFAHFSCSCKPVTYYYKVTVEELATYLGSSVSNQKNLQKTSNKRIQISQNIKLKKLEIASRMPSVELGNNVKNSEFACCNTEVPHTIDSRKPPKVGVQVQLHSDVGVSNAFDRMRCKVGKIMPLASIGEETEYKPVCGPNDSRAKS